MKTTLPNPTDAHDWRDAIPGLVRLEPGHVYGKTALSQQEWRQLAHRRHGQQFVLLYDGPHVSRRVDSLPKRYEAAQADFAYGLEVVGRSYHPHSGRRLSVMAEADWHGVVEPDGGPSGG